jgi:Icc-related predicted phosphoesterase
MKLLHITDLHSHSAWFDWLIAAAPRFDLVCVTGDTLNLGDLSSEIDREIDDALNRLVQIKTPLAICSGNHDLHYLGGQDRAQWMQALRRKNVWLDGDAFWFHDYRFRCVGWCDPVPRDSKADIFLMHAPPFGAKTSTVAGGVSFGDEELRDACMAGEGPRLFTLGGHVHRALGFWSVLHETITLNPGQGDHPDIPNHIVLDLHARTMTHHRATQLGTSLTKLSFRNN